MSPGVFSAGLVGRSWLSDHTFDCELSRPECFRFTPGQGIRFLAGGIERDYSISSGDRESRLAIHVRLVPGGAFSPLLARAPIGSRFSFSGPHGFFILQDPGRHSFFVATGVGIAPFLSMARSGSRGFTILHGVRTADELHHREIMEDAAHRYMPCVSRATPRDVPGAFEGRVTSFLREHFPQGNRDFYLCGRREMIRDVTLLVDERAPGAKVFAEIFS